MIGWPYSKVGGHSTIAPLQGGPEGGVKKIPPVGRTQAGNLVVHCA